MWQREFLSVGFFAWLCWWWVSWVGVATMVVDVGGSGYGFMVVDFWVLVVVGC